MSKSDIEGRALAAQITANKVYEDAIAAREYFEAVQDAVPIENQDLRYQVIKWQEEAVNTINSAWKAKVAAEQMLEAVQKLG